MTRRWSRALMDELRWLGDPDVDELVLRSHWLDGDHSRAQAHDEPHPHHTAPSRTGLDPAIEAFIDGTDGRPEWVDEDLVARGQETFRLYAPHIGFSLFAASLPQGYLYPSAAQVLDATARLCHDGRRRIQETGQFLLDVMAKGGLRPGAPGWRSSRRVRVIHARVRQLLRSERHPEPASGAARSSDLVAGEPINQEDLLGTLLTFTTVVFDALAQLGIELTPDEQDAYSHTWSLVGHLLGIRPDLLPVDVAQLREIEQIERARVRTRSSAGVALTAELVTVMRRATPWNVPAFLPAAAVRYFIGDDDAELLDVPYDWGARLLFRPAVSLTRWSAIRRVRNRGLRWASQRVFRAMLDEFVTSGRTRPPELVMPGRLRTSRPEVAE